MNVSSLGRARRSLLWGFLAAVLGGALLVSFSFTGRAVSKAEIDAERQAEDATNTVLYKALTPGLISRPIESREYGDILIDVQAGILSDDDVVRVRIWNTNGTLVFSSDQRDRLGQEAQADGLIHRVAGGSTVSEVSGARVPPKPGLAGSNQRLFQSYVPLRLGERVSVSAVAEIDRRYAAIEARARAVWLPIQIGLGVGLLAAVVMLLVSIRTSSAPAASRGAVGDPRAAERARALEKQLKDAHDRVKKAEAQADASERAKAAVEQRLAASGREMRDGLAAGKTDGPDATALAARVSELERELAEARARASAAAVPAVSREDLTAAQRQGREAEAERDRLATEIERLHIAMSEGGAAHARAAELEARAQEAENRAAELEAGAQETERRAAEAEERSKTSLERSRVDLDGISIRLSETQAALAEATDRVGQLEGEVQRLEQERTNANAELRRVGLASGENDEELRGLRTAVAERDEELGRLGGAVEERDRQIQELQRSLTDRVAELEQARAEAIARTSEVEQVRREAVAGTGELEQLRAEAVARAAELQRLRAGAGAADEVEQMRAALASKQEELVRLRNELEHSLAQAQAAAEAQALAGAQAATEAGPDVAELRRRSGELEDLHRTDVSEMQRAHELLANAQHELAQAKRRTEDLEERLAARSEIAAEPVPSAGADGSPVFAPPDEATIGSRLTAFRKRRPSPRLEETPPPAEQWQPPATVEPEPVEGPPRESAPTITPEGLSLRERLTRAAAARHRVTAPSDRDES